MPSMITCIRLAVGLTFCVALGGASESRRASVIISVVDEHGAPRPYRLASLKAAFAFTKASREQDLATSSGSLKVDGLELVPYRAVLEPLSKALVRGRGGERCFDERFETQFCLRGYGQSKLVLGRSLRCESNIDWEQDSRAEWTLRNRPTGPLWVRLRPLFAHAEPAQDSDVSASGVFHIRPAGAGMYTMTVFRGAEVLGHVDFGVFWEDLVPGTKIAIDWSTRRRISFAGGVRKRDTTMPK